MTIISDPVEWMIMETTAENVERPHIACCVADVFLCGAPFHPELVASESDSEDDCCEPCVEIMYALLCPPWRPTHQHCVKGIRICPP